MVVLSLGWEDPLEEGMASHSSVLAERHTGAWQATAHRVTESDTTEENCHPIKKDIEWLNE